MKLRFAILSRPACVRLVVLLSVAILTGVVTRAGEPNSQKAEKNTVAFDHLIQASALVERLSERVKAQKAALQEAEADLLAAQKLADELRKLAVEEEQANAQRSYEAHKRNQKELRGDRLVPKDSLYFIGPLGKLPD